MCHKFGMKGHANFKLIVSAHYALLPCVYAGRLYRLSIGSDVMNTAFAGLPS